MFQITTPGHASKCIPLPADIAVLIGRGDSCGVQLKDPSASRVHCRVIAHDGRVTLYDAGSRWGTFVNGQRVTECDLRPGDRIKIGETVQGIGRDEVLRLPDRRFFRRRGEPAFQMVGHDGETFAEVEEYIAHVLAHLPEAYRASVDVKHWIEMQRGVSSGTIELKKAVNAMPRLARVGGACPCSKSVRWVMDVPEGGTGGEERLNP